MLHKKVLLSFFVFCVAFFLVLSFGVIDVKPVSACDGCVDTSGWDFGGGSSSKNSGSSSSGSDNSGSSNSGSNGGSSSGGGSNVSGNNSGGSGGSGGNDSSSVSTGNNNSGGGNDRSDNSGFSSSGNDLLATVTSAAGNQVSLDEDALREMISGILNELLAEKLATLYQPMAPTEPAGAVVQAVRSSNKLILNGESVELPAVNIGGFNYMKLRDMAYILCNTDKQFALEYDSDAQAISLVLGTEYAPIGGELANTLSEEPSATASPQGLLIDETTVSVAAYNIDGNNFFRLRDIAILLNFDLDFDEITNSTTLLLDKAYTE